AEHLLDLVRVDVGAAPDDQVLDAPGDVEIAIFIEEAQVPRVHPAVLRVGPAGLSPVALLHRWAAHTDLAPIGDHRLRAVVGPAHRGPALCLRVAGGPDRELPGVHRAVENADP